MAEKLLPQPENRRSQGHFEAASHPTRIMLCGIGREELAEGNVRDKREQRRRSRLYLSQLLNGRHDDLGMMKSPSWFTKSSIIRYEMVGFLNAR
jgi:hypothetical protein